MVEEATTESQRDIFPSYSSKELLAMLTEHTSNYTENGEMLPVRFVTNRSSYISEEGSVHINPVNAWKHKEDNDLSEKQGLRILLNTVSHEVGHYNHSELDSKKRFVENYPVHGKIAGSVVNILEDVYIDRNRTDRFEGLRRPHRWVRNAREDGFEPHKMDSTADKAIKVLAGTSDTENFRCPVEVEGQFLEDWARKCEVELAKIPDADSQADRVAIAHRLTATLLQKVEDPEIEDEEMEDDILDKETEDLAERLDDRATELDEEMEEENIEEHSDEEISESVKAAAEEEEEETEEPDEDIEPEDSPDGETEEESESGSGESSSGESAEDEEKEEGTPGGQNDDLDLTRWEDTNPESQEELVTEESIQQLGKGLSQAQQDGVELSDDVIEVLEELGEEDDKKRTVNTAKGKTVDVSKAIRRKAGDKSETKIFEKEVTEEQDGEDTAVGITLDASGSMNGGGMKQGLTAVGALGKAQQELDQDFTANTFWSKSAEESGMEDLDRVDVGTTTITGIEDDFTMDDLDDVDCRYLDPLALGVEEAGKDLKKADAENKLLFVVTDGNPTVLKDGTNAEGGPDQEIVEECRKEVEKHRDLGIEIIGVAAGKSPSEDTMADIFGANEWFRFEQENLAEKLLTVFRNTVDT